jgi:hypothetical protein
MTSRHSATLASLLGILAACAPAATSDDEPADEPPPEGGREGNKPGGQNGGSGGTTGSGGGQGGNEAPAAPRPSVVFSEIMYHPVGEASAQDEHEFIELHNPTRAAVSLRGVRLVVDGKDRFTFPQNASVPAGGYVVVA